VDPLGRSHYTEREGPQPSSVVLLFAALALGRVLVLLPIGHGGAFKGLGFSLYLLTAGSFDPFEIGTT
jgi:hypothetical protein